MYLSNPPPSPLVPDLSTKPKRVKCPHAYQNMNTLTSRIVFAVIFWVDQRFSVAQKNSFHLFELHFCSNEQRDRQTNANKGQNTETQGKFLS